MLSPPDGSSKGRRQKGSLELSRQDAQSTAEAFIQAYKDNSKQTAKSNALSDLKAGCRSMQFVSHLQKLPPSIFIVVLDIVCANCFEGDANELKDDMVMLLYEITRGATIGYPSTAMAKVLSALVQTIIREIVNDENSDLEDLSFVLHLQTLSTCLHGNVGVKLFVTELPTKKELVRTLAMMLNRTDDASVLIYSMSILARLVLNESVGKKLFQPKNVEHAVELISAVVVDKGNTSLLTMDNSSTRERVHLQLASIDMLIDLASQPYTLETLESSNELKDMTLTMLERLNMNENILRLQVALHFLHVVSSLSHRLKKDVGNAFPPLSRSLPVALHPVPMLAISATKFFVDFFADDRSLVEALINATCNNPTNSSATEGRTPPNEGSEKLVGPLQPALIGLFRTLHATITLLVRRGGEFADFADEYDHAVLISQLLVRLSVDNRIWALSLPLVNMSQMVGLAQREVQHMNTLPSEQFIQHTPKFSLAFLTLVGTLMIHDDVDDSILRDFNQMLQNPDIAILLSRGLNQCDDKQWTMDVLAFLRRFLSQARGIFHERVSLLTLGDTLFSTSQKVQEVFGLWQTRLSQSDTSLQLTQKHVEHLKKEMDMIKTNANDERLQFQTELARLQKELDMQKSAQNQLLEAVTSKCEAQLDHMKAQCDSMYTQIQEKTQVIEKKQRQLQECRVQRCSLEEETNGLKRKLLVLELRIDEVAQAHAAARVEIEIKDRDKKKLQAEMESISEAYAAQGGELLATQDAFNKMKAAMHLQEEKHEAIYKQLVLLSKAHQQQSAELHRAIDGQEETAHKLQEARSLIENMKNQADDQDSRIQAHKDQIAELEGSIKRYEHALHDEKISAHELRGELEMLRHEHVKMQSELLAKDASAFELQRQAEANQKIIHQRDHEVLKLRNELKKYAKIQAMIQQLIDGASLTTLSQQSNGSNSPTSHHGFVPETQLSQ